MVGKLGLVVGLAAGYVLGTRAGRQRYEQIKAQAEKVWNLDPVQKQVASVQEFAKSSLASLPSTLVDTASKVTRAASGKGTLGKKIDAASQTTGQNVSQAVKRSADDLSSAASTTASEAEKAAADAAEDLAKQTGDRTAGG